MSRKALASGGLLLFAALLALAWWGWSQGGLALLQMGMSLC